MLLGCPLLALVELPRGLRCERRARSPGLDRSDEPTAAASSRSRRCLQTLAGPALRSRRGQDQRTRLRASSTGRLRERAKDVPAAARRRRGALPPQSRRADQGASQERKERRPTATKATSLWSIKRERVPECKHRQRRRRRVLQEVRTTRSRARTRARRAQGARKNEALRSRSLFLVASTAHRPARRSAGRTGGHHQRRAPSA